MMEFTITSENNLSVLIDELNFMLEKARIDSDAIENAIDEMHGKMNSLPLKIDLEKNNVIFAALQDAVERHDWQA